MQGEKSTIKEQSWDCFVIRSTFIQNTCHHFNGLGFYGMVLENAGTIKIQLAMGAQDTP